MAEFLALYPRIRVEVLLDDAKTDLIAERIDVAFRSGSLLRSSSVGRKLIDSPSILIASPAYLAKNGAPTYAKAISPGYFARRQV
jgi:DNA-binding transcriptional LysR family regulator